MRSRKWTFALLGTVLLISGTVARAEDASSASQAESPEQKAFLDKLRALDWVKGPTTVTADGNAKLTIPEHYLYLDARNTLKFLELQQNLGNGHEVMVAPSDLQWQAYLEFSDEGYIKDDEKIDAPGLLKTLK